MKFKFSDGVSTEVVDAANFREARSSAQEWVLRGDWGNGDNTTWVDVTITRVRDGETVEMTVAVSPPAPACVGDGEHDWCSPHDVLGGNSENPGVVGHGGGVVITKVCAWCGCYRITDTWAQRPDTGEQGLESTTYRPADQASRAYVERSARE